MEIIENFGRVLKTSEPELYKVYKVWRNSDRRQVLEKNLTREQAIRIVKSHPNRKKTMVIFTKQL